MKANTEVRKEAPPAPVGSQFWVLAVELGAVQILLCTFPPVL